VPVVLLDSLSGGLKIIKEGGGKQTESLKLLATNGIYYTLRSINKKTDALIPESVFTEEAETLKQLLTDNAIDKALHQWPK
jgi:hypothetical protein